MTVTPVLSYWLLTGDKSTHHDHDSPLLRVLKWIAGFAIRTSVRHPWPILLSVLLAVVVSVVTVTQLGRDFLLPRLVRRYAAEGTQEGVNSVVRLLKAAPTDADRAKDLGVINIANALPQVLAPGVAALVLGLGAGYSTLYVLAALAAVLGSILVRRIVGVP